MWLATPLFIKGQGTATPVMISTRLGLSRRAWSGYARAIVRPRECVIEDAERSHEGNAGDGE